MEPSYLNANNSDLLIISRPLYITENVSECGYCKGKKENVTNYFSLDSSYKKHFKNNKLDIEVNNCTLGLYVELTSIEIYDKFCNQGFRRSGRYLYKPDLLRNCCKLYTIRTSLNQCKFTKDLKTTMKRFKKFTGTTKYLNDNGLNSNNEQFDLVKETYLIDKYSPDFYTRYEPCNYTNEKFELFKKYQESIHNDTDVTSSMFERFLCLTPFSKDVVNGDKDEWETLNNISDLYEMKYLGKEKILDYNVKIRSGPAHECYYHNNKLIAISVLDFLPSGVSSVYFIWDPDYPKWALGKVSALRELALVSLLGLKYYYMGYYIEDCPKMNYKEKYGGELLDVCNNQYIPIDLLKSFIKNGKFFTLGNVEDNQDIDENDEYYSKVELPLNDKINLDLEKPLVNIAEQLFGDNSNSINYVNMIVDKLRKYGINYPSNLMNDYFQKSLPSNNNIYRMPDIVPGLMPLWQVLQLIESNDINRLNSKLMIYYSDEKRMRVVKNIMDEDTDTKKTIFNVIRLIGLELTVNALIVI